MLISYKYTFFKGQKKSEFFITHRKTKITSICHSHPKKIKIEDEEKSKAQVKAFSLRYQNIILY